ncbi:hypothetical protein B484DRAFT_126348 [Ochromonadaceae sp. CCMP2298]|nr:hypothetical protein B484DRAFT_126348 [Ochromonadaceae sp. CCMP2298]
MSSAPQQFTLFVGDLSIFCSEEDLNGAFEEFGDLLEVKIIRCEETKKNLSYGFVKFATHEGALRAMDMRTGHSICGRPLRIGWASRRQRSDLASTQAPPERSSVHVTYSSNQIDKVVTEEYFAQVFGRFGTVVDSAVKRFEINEVQQFQKGYGFVHFPFTGEGVAAALRCCEDMHNQTSDRVTYKCSISHRLQQSMSAIFGMGMIMGTEPTGVHGTGLPQLNPYAQIVHPYMYAFPQQVLYPFQRWQAYSYPYFNPYMGNSTTHGGYVSHQEQQRYKGQKPAQYEQWDEHDGTAANGMHADPTTLSVLLVNETADPAVGKEMRVLEGDSQNHTQPYMYLGGYGGYLGGGYNQYALYSMMIQQHRQQQQQQQQQQAQQAQQAQQRDSALHHASHYSCGGPTDSADDSLSGLLAVTCTASASPTAPSRRPLGELTPQLAASPARPDSAPSVDTPVNNEASAIDSGSPASTLAPQMPPSLSLGEKQKYTL